MSACRKRREVFALAAGMWLALAADGAAQTVWDDPGKDPYPGALTEGVLKLADCGAPYAALAQLAWKAQRGACEESEVEDGERFDRMLSAHSCLHDVLTRISGSPGWVGKTRRKLDCSDRWGNHLIIPEACNNASYAYRPPAVAPPPEVVLIPGYPAGGAWLPGPAIAAGFVGGVVSGSAGGFVAGAAAMGSFESVGTSSAAVPVAVGGFAGRPGETASAGEVPGSRETVGPNKAASPGALPLPVPEPWSAPILALAVLIVAVWKWYRI